MTPELQVCIETFRRWLHLPHPGHILVTLAAVAANRAPGDPVWLLLIGGPSAGKTEPLMALKGLPDIHLAGVITEPSLLSGTPKRERANSSKGGLLREIGDFGILVAKDFTSVLTMNTDTRSAVLSALRECYDGSWTRNVGTDGGRTLHWSGKLGLLAGCTAAWDAHYSVISSLGDRFLIYRLPDASEALADRAVDHIEQEPTMRAELAEAAALVLEHVDQDRLSIKVAGEDKARLVALAALAARCRSAIMRDSYRREIELIPPPEAPARLALSLLRLRNGLLAIGCSEAGTWKLTAQCTLDCIPPIRLAALRRILAGYETVRSIAEALDYPHVTVRRALEDLAAHKVLHRVPQDEPGEPDIWTPTKWLTEHWQAVSGIPPDTGKGSKEKKEQNAQQHSPTGFSETGDGLFHPWPAEKRGGSERSG